MKIIWLTSYPKSGNTWMRVFLENYRRNRPDPVDINTVDIPNAASHLIVERITGLDSSELFFTESGPLRRAAYDFVSSEADSEVIYKLHDVFNHERHPEGLVSRTATRVVIYIVRNPLDVCISYATHEGTSVDSAIKRMGQEHYFISPAHDDFQFTQIIGNWSLHVASWIDECDLPLLLLRYEDLLEKPEVGFRAVVESSGWDVDEERLARAIEFSRFDVLKNQEDTHGFREQSLLGERFFQRGRSRYWRDTLSTDQVDAVVQDHADMMRRMGYLDQQGNVLEKYRTPTQYRLASVSGSGTRD